MSIPQNTQENKLYRLLSIEDTEDILSFSVKGQDFLLWPFLRFSFFQYLLNPTDNPADVSISLPRRQFFHKQRHPNREKFFHFLPSMCSPWPKRDIWYLSNISAYFYKYVDGYFIDIYNDTFANITPDKSMYIAQSPAAEETIKKKWYPYKFLQSSEIFFEKVFKFFVRQCDKKLANEIIVFLKMRCLSCCNILLPENYWDNLERKILYIIGYSRIQYKFYQALFCYRKPRLLVLREAYYGCMSHIIPLARAHNITTVEIQHGAISYVHPAYNWARTLCENTQLKKYMVDHFLTFGSFWHNRIHIPGEYQEIGAPWFTIQRDRHKCNGDAILFCLPDDHSTFNPFITEIVKTFPQKKIIVRVHPSQRALFQRTGIPGIQGIIIDNNSDIYETFSSAEIIIGTESTSLCEALALGKRVFVLETGFSKTFYSPLPVCLFSKTDELIRLIKDPLSGKISVQQQQSLFCTDWEKNYSKFLESLHIK